MFVLNYMAQQREQIRQRHSGEEYFYQSEREKSSPVKLLLRPAGEILCEIDSMSGLNVAGRKRFLRAKEQAAFTH